MASGNGRGCVAYRCVFYKIDLKHMKDKNFVYLTKLVILFIFIILSIDVFAIKHSRKMQRDTILANQFQYRADSLFNLKEFKEATFKYLDAAELFEKHEVWDRSVHNFGRAGLMFLIRKEHDSASYYLNTAKSISEKYLNLNLYSNKVIKSEIVDFLGHLYFDKREYDFALRYYNESLMLINEFIRNNRTMVYKKANSYNYIGTCYFYKRDYTRALDYAFKALNLEITIGGWESPKLGKLYYNIAGLYRDKRDYIKAIDYYEKTIEILQQHSDLKDYSYATSYNNLASLYFDLEDYDKSYKIFKIVYDLYEQQYGSNSSQCFSILNRLGHVQIKKKDFDSAYSYITQSLILKLNANDHNSIDVGESIETLAQYYNAINKDDSALLMYDKAKEIYKLHYGVKSTYVSKINYEIGLIHLKNEEIKLALNYLQEAIVNNVKGFADTSILSNPKIFHKSSTGKIINDSIVILSKPLLFDIIKEKAKALNSYYKRDNSNIELLKKSYETFYLGTNLLEIIRLEMTEEGSKFLLSNKSKELYNEFINVAYNLYTLDLGNAYKQSLFDIIEMSKSSVLRDQIKEKFAIQNSNIPVHLIEKEKTLAKELAYYSTLSKKIKTNNLNITDSMDSMHIKSKAFQLSYEYDTLLNYFEKEYFTYKNSKVIESYTVEQIQRQLDSIEIVVNYYIGNNKLYIITIDKENYYITSSTINSNFEDIVYNFYKSIKKYNSSGFITNGDKLYKTLIEPIEDIIINKERLFFIPNDYLYYIPFEAIFKNRDVNLKAFSYQSLDYLILDFEISYYHTASLWYKNRKINLKDSLREPSFVGFAPVFSEDSELNAMNYSFENSFRAIETNGKMFASLPYSEKEISSIQSQFNNLGLKSKIFLYKEASKSNFKKNIKGYKYIHVATHGFSNDKSPELSGLAFSSISEIPQVLDNGILYSGEMYNLSLDADLVVLSTCESGVGKLIAGEGLVAIIRGFINSGVPNIVFSLWKVPDQMTCEFMNIFYKNILNGDTYSKSLRTVKVDMIKNSKNVMPRFWSSFILFGI